MNRDRTNATRKTGIIGTVLAASLALASSLASSNDENLLPNPSFDTDISGWSINTFVTEPNARWSDDDASGDAASGSAEVDFIGIGNNATQTGLFVCLPSAPGREYRFGGAGKLKQETEGAIASIFLSPNDDEGCNNPVGQSTLSYWSTDWEVKESTYITPEGTTHIRFMIGTGKWQGFDETLGSRFDDLFLIEVIEDMVFEDRFED